jgi:hypothetical protein
VPCLALPEMENCQLRATHFILVLDATWPHDFSRVTIHSRMARPKRVHHSYNRGARHACLSDLNIL